MSRRIVVLHGHPDPAPSRLGAALGAAYAEAARAAGHDVREIRVAALDFPFLRTSEEWNHGPLPAGLRAAQEDIGWAEHLVIIFPLWTGTLPAYLKGFFEQVMRPGFAFRYVPGRGPVPDLGGRSARVVVTMGMPALAFRWLYGARGVRCFERNLLNFVGIRPVRKTYIGMVDSPRFPAARWLERMRRWGRAGE